MKSLASRTVVILIVMSLATKSLGDTPLPVTTSTFEQRLHESFKRVIFVSSRPMTNRVKVEDEVLAELHSVTPESAQKPLVVASRYMPEMENGMGVFVSWIEDYPRLQEIKVRNPETGEQINVRLPLDDAIKDADSILIYRSFFILPDGFVKGITQTLEISAPGQKIPATCYPSIYSEADNAPAATKPSNR